MTASRSTAVPRSAPRLRASPNFVLAFSQDGRPYVAQETEPYLQFWLSQRYRILLSLFSGRRGSTDREAVDAYFRFIGAEPQDAERKRLLRAVADMHQAGVLVGARDDVSRYDARMAQDYLRHRPFPQALADHLVRAAPVRPDSRVLDLAGGPGSLALALARVANEVALMELSRGFVQAARARAAALGLRLDAIHESANRLMYSDEAYDVVTVSQALHWLDDVAVCRGLCRVLRAGGSFFVVQAAMDIAAAHPLAPVLGDDSVLGKKDPQPFHLQARALQRRLALLFEALDAPDVQRHDPGQGFEAASEAPPRIVPAGAAFFRQQRPFDLGYARAFLTPRHIEATGQAPLAFWRALEARCAGRGDADFLGHMDWAVLQFRRAGAPVALLDGTPPPVGAIPWDGPAD